MHRHLLVWLFAALIGSGCNCGAGGGGLPSCSLGQAGSAATSDTLNLFGEIVRYADGGALEAGRYEVRYRDGCMKYSATQGWTIHAYANGSAGWWLVGSSTDDKVMMPPGTNGYAAGEGAYAVFADCVTANLALPPTQFDFDGGVLGVWLQDNPYTDNVAGESGRNPSWELTRVDAGCQ